MSSQKCSHNKCHLDVYDGEECIFHCKKTKDNGWIINDEWDPKKVQEFWKKYSNEKHRFPEKSLIPPILLSKEMLKEDNKKIWFNAYNCEFLGDFEIYELNKDLKLCFHVSKSIFHGKLSFLDFFNFSNSKVDIHLNETIHKGNIEIFSQNIGDVWIKNITVNMLRLGIGEGKSPNKYESIFIFNDNDKYKIEDIDVKNTNVSNGFIIKNIVINSLDCSNSIFESKVEIYNSVIKKNASFENTKFKKVTDFSNTVFHQSNFTNTSFENTTSFIESKFYDNVNFKYTVFEKLVLFRNATFKKSINLEDSIIKGEANFLKITSTTKEIKVANKETARIIKHSFDKVGNTIEANRYFSYEMKKELENPSNLSRPYSWMLHLNSFISNFGQSWIRPLLLIIYFLVMQSLVFCLMDNWRFDNGIIRDFWIGFNQTIHNFMPFKKFLVQGREFVSLIFLIVYSILIYNLVVAVKRITKR